MSDSFRKVAGTALIIISALLCLIALVPGYNGGIKQFRSANKTRWALNDIPTERNGNISVNTADADELTELPGIGEAYAALIIAERGENGPFFYAEDLEAIKGIGPKTLEKFRDKINLSTDEGD